MKKKIIISLALVAIIILGIIFTTIIMLNSNLLYKEHKQIDISLGKEFENSDIEGIVKEVTGSNEVVIQKLEVYEDMVSISVKEISDEQLENLNTKINEKYEIENAKEDLKVIDIPKVTFGDYIKPYIKPLLISLLIIAIYVVGYILIDRRIKNSNKK